MKAIKEIPAWAIILALLLIMNLAWMTWNNVYQHVNLSPTQGQFTVEVLHTNEVSPWPYLSGDNASAIGIVEVKTGEPLWAKWNLDRGENMDIESLLFHGKKVFDIYWVNGHPLVYNVYFRGPGKSVTWWQNRDGANTFTERTFYDTNGVLSRDEVWCNQAWQTVDKRNGTNGIIVDGQWHQLAFDTNRMWKTEAP